MKHFFRSPVFWIVSTIVSGIMCWYAFTLFPVAFSIVQLDITMERAQALDQAKIIAQKYELGPADYQQAATFNTDELVKTFVELEGGGKDAFVAMMHQKKYMPYTWAVRHFKEFEKNETVITFTPDGIPYGFVETISEDLAGEQKNKQEAQKIAQQFASTDWNIDFSDYSLIEASEKIQPSGRADHTFVFERDEKIGEGFFRLTVRVSGDKVTQLTHSVKVPETFIRRYGQMRSANNTIAMAASLIMMLLYFVGGCIIGLFILFRKRLVLQRAAFLWGSFLAFLTVLTQINQLPLAWMMYNTAFSTQGFLLRLLVSLVTLFISQTFFIALVVMAAEGLTRTAFGHHPQLWRCMTLDAARSLAVIARVYGGYLIVGFNILFVVLFYLFSTRYLEWWTPSEALYNPNILATYFPWLSPLVLSLNAGFLEECLFRAVPLAGAAIIGKRYGKQNVCIAIAFILQAVVFGAAHANYPAQPAYARMVELILPSFMWGAIYLKFGLLPTIITHFTYDVVWFSIPIFISNSPHAFYHQAIIILLTLTPLFISVYARIKKGALTELDPKNINASWQPPLITQDATVQEEIPQETITLSETKRKGIIIVGIAGLIAALFFTPYAHDGIKINLEKNKAVEQANTFLANEHIQRPPTFTTLPLVFAQYDSIRAIELQHRFVWQYGGKNLYHQLLGTYLEPSHWTIRYAQFEGDVVQRAEEHRVMLTDDSVLRYLHLLPESQEGAQLNQHEARTIVHETIKQRFNIDPQNLKEISAQETQHPQRKDWLFIFSHEDVYPLEKGQARINVLVSGDKVTDATRYIHVPEEWERAEQNKQNMADTMKMLCSLFLILFFIFFGSALMLHEQASDYSFLKKIFVTIFTLLFLLQLINSANSLPQTIGMFNTTEPFTNQLFRLVATSLFSLFMYTSFLTIAVVYSLQQKRGPTLLKHNLSPLCLGLLGTFVAGILAYTAKIVPSTQPLWPDYTPLGAYSPLIASVIATLFGYITITLLMIFFCLVVDHATNHWHKRRPLLSIFFILFGLALHGSAGLNDISTWLVMGTVLGGLLLSAYHGIIRFDHSIIPLATAGFMMVHIIQQGLFSAYPGAFVAAVTNVIIIRRVAQWWWQQINK